MVHCPVCEHEVRNPPPAGAQTVCGYCETQFTIPGKAAAAARGRSFQRRGASEPVSFRVNGWASGCLFFGTLSLATVWLALHLDALIGYARAHQLAAGLVGLAAIHHRWAKLVSYEIPTVMVMVTLAGAVKAFRRRRLYRAASFWWVALGLCMAAVACVPGARAAVSVLTAALQKGPG